MEMTAYNAYNTAACHLNCMATTLYPRTLFFHQRRHLIYKEKAAATIKSSLVSRSTRRVYCGCRYSAHLTLPHASCILPQYILPCCRRLNATVIITKMESDAMPHTYTHAHTDSLR